MFCDFAVLVACATGFCIDRKTRVFDRFGVQNPITPAIVGFDLIDDRCTFGWALNAISDFVWGMVLQIMMGCKKMVAKQCVAIGEGKLSGGGFQRSGYDSGRC